MAAEQPAVLSLPDAERLAEWVLRAIDHVQSGWHVSEDDADWPDIYAADRERVASDLAGLREHASPLRSCSCLPDWLCPDARRYSDGLLRTARLYGVAP